MLNPGITARNALAHELGHAGGYDKGDLDAGTHSSDPNNIMDRASSGATPDECWCCKVMGLATAN